MREAKQKFDDLVAKLKSGNDVSFGQMERVYAEGFLQSFLQRSAKQRERAIANLRRQQRDLQDEDYDGGGETEDSFSNEAIDRQELDYLRNIVETLGVKPSIDQLHQYAERAIQRSSWDMLGDVLSISQEGKLGSGTLETMAVKELGSGRIHSYMNLKKQFPQIEVSPEKMNPVYTQLLSTGDLGKLKEIREEVNLPVPEDVCQTSYESLLRKRDKSSVRAMHKLREATGVVPRKTEGIKESFDGIFDSPESDLGIAELEELNDLFGVYSDKELAISAQRSALKAGRIDYFAHLWNKSNNRILEEDMGEAYCALDQNRAYDSIFKLMEITRISPKCPIFSRAASAELSKAEDLRGVKNLIDIARETPEFEQTSVDNFSERISSRGNTKVLTELSKLGGKIKPEYVHTTAARFIEGNYSKDITDLEQRITEFYETFGLKPIEEVSIKLLGINIRNAIREEAIHRIGSESILEGLLAKVKERGLEIKRELHDEIARDLVLYSENVGRSLLYLKKLTKIKDFSDQVSDSAKERMGRDLSNADLSQYAALKKLGADAQYLEEWRKNDIARGLIGKLGEDLDSNMRAVKRIIELGNIKFGARPYELEAVIEKYFEGGIENTMPSKITRLLHISLDNQEQVRNLIYERTLKLIDKGYLREARRLYADTGIRPSKEGAERFLQRYERNVYQSQKEMARRLNFVYGKNSGLS